MQLIALFRLALASAPILPDLNLAAYRNSQVRSTKSTRSRLNRAPSVCKHRVSGSFSLPSRGPFHLSLTVLFAIGHQVVFSLGGWSPLFPAGFLVSCGTLDSAPYRRISLTWLLHPLAALSNAIQLSYCRLPLSTTPRSMPHGLGSFPFARRYSGNRSFFLLLRVLRCFSSPGSLFMSIDSS